MSAQTMIRVALQVNAARRANQLAIRFARKGETQNANAARVIALQAIQAARAIVQSGE